VLSLHRNGARLVSVDAEQILTKQHISYCARLDNAHAGYTKISLKRPS